MNFGKKLFPTLCDQRLTASKVEAPDPKIRFLTVIQRDQRLTASKVEAQQSKRNGKQPFLVINALRHQRLRHLQFQNVGADFHCDLRLTASKVEARRFY